MLQGIDFISGGHDDEQEKKISRKGESGFELSRPVGIKKDEQKKATKKKDKKEQLKSQENKEAIGAVEDKKAKKDGWWKKIFKKSSKSLVVQEVVDKGKSEDKGEMAGDGLGGNLKDFKQVLKEEKVKGKIDVRGGGGLDSELGEKEKKEISQPAQADTTTLSQILSGNREVKEREPDFDINLMPQEKKHMSVGQRIWLMLLIFFITAGVEIFVYGVLKKNNGEQLSKIAGLNGQAKELEQTVSKMNGEIEGALRWYVKAGAAEELFREHKWWSKFFTALESNTHVNTYYTSLGVDNMDKVSLKGIAKDYKSLAQAILGYEDADGFIYEYNVSGVSMKEGEKDEANEQTADVINFLLTFNIEPNFLIYDGLK